MSRKLYLIGYDIASTQRRREVLLSVKGNAVGGQKSLYECWLTRRELNKALLSLRSIIDPDEDRVLVIELDPRATIHTTGIAVEPPNGGFFYQG